MDQPAERGKAHGFSNSAETTTSRFLTTDPIVANRYSGQSFNAYSYVVNNPLTLVDPSGFEPEKPPILSSSI
jgi:hypothetical protein